MPSGRPGGVPQPCPQLSVTQVRECPPHTDVARQSPSHCPFPPGRPHWGQGSHPYCCFLAEPMSLPLSPRKAHTGGRGPIPYCCFLAEPMSLPLSPRRACTGMAVPPHTTVSWQNPCHCPFPPGRPTLGAGVPPHTAVSQQSPVIALAPQEGPLSRPEQVLWKCVS